MPELPEVETVRRSITPALEGAAVVAVDVRHPRMLRRQPRPRDFRDRLLGRSIDAVGRHGKFLMLEVEGDLTWVLHLGMSGRIRLVPPDEPPLRHTHVVVDFDRPESLHFVDPRTFGFTAVFTPEERAAQPFDLLGPDALTQLPRYPVLARRMHNRRVPIKALLLDQRFLAGLGNIYADEVLHRARLLPGREAGTLSDEEIRGLRNAIRPVLEGGLRYGGTSLDDLAYLLPDGRAGEYLNRLRVYGREGEPCRRDGSMIRRSVIAGRSSYWCPDCQK